MMKVSIHQQDSPLINIYVPNRRASKYMKRDMHRGRNRQCNSNRWILRMPYSVMDRTRQKKSTNRRLGYHYKSTRTNRHL